MQKIKSEQHSYENWKRRDEYNILNHIEVIDLREIKKLSEKFW